LPDVSVGFVADPEMNANPAFVRIGVTAVTSCEPAGPMIPTIELFDANCCATVEAFDGSSCVSPCTIFSFGVCVLFHSETKNCAQWSWSPPIEAAGPVIGAIIPSETVPEQPPVPPPPALPVEAGVVGAAVVSVLPPPPPQPAATTASASAAPAAAARTALIAFRLPRSAGLKRRVTPGPRAVM